MEIFGVRQMIKHMFSLPPAKGNKKGCLLRSSIFVIFGFVGGFANAEPSRALVIAETITKPLQAQFAKEDIGMSVAGALMSRGVNRNTAKTFGNALNENFNLVGMKNVLADAISRGLSETQQSELLVFVQSPHGQNYLDALAKSKDAINSYSPESAAMLNANEQALVRTFFNSDTGFVYSRSTDSIGNELYRSSMLKACASSKRLLSVTEWNSLAELCP